MISINKKIGIISFLFSCCVCNVFADQITAEFSILDSNSSSYKRLCYAYEKAGFTPPTVKEVIVNFSNGSNVVFNKPHEHKEVPGDGIEVTGVEIVLSHNKLPASPVTPAEFNNTPINIKRNGIAYNNIIINDSFDVADNWGKNRNNNNIIFPQAISAIIAKNVGSTDEEIVRTTEFYSMQQHTMKKHGKRVFSVSCNSIRLSKTGRLEYVNVSVDPLIDQHAQRILSGN